MIWYDSLTRDWLKAAAKPSLLQVKSVGMVLLTLLNAKHNLIDSR